jgi:hypothetical protein
VAKTFSYKHPFSRSTLLPGDYNSRVRADDTES